MIDRQSSTCSLSAAKTQFVLLLGPNLTTLTDSDTKSEAELQEDGVKAPTSMAQGCKTPSRKSARSTWLPQRFANQHEHEYLGKTVGHCRHFCHLLSRTSQSETGSRHESFLLCTKEQEKGFFQHIYWLAWNCLVCLVVQSARTQKGSAMDSRGLTCQRLKVLGEPLMLTCYMEAKLPGYWNLGRCEQLQRRAKCHKQQRLNGLLVVQILEWTMLSNQYQGMLRGFFFLNNPSSTFFSGHYSTKLPVFFVGFPAPSSERAHRKRREEWRRSQN